MNIYQTSFDATCPKDGQLITYSLTIETLDQIWVEVIEEQIKSLSRIGFHETIADKLKQLGGKQTLVATHKSVTITTIR
jgi:hypothetical protein